ncbi:hypothetical protein [Streptobacillus ratti]|uniref:hypothetical protein n=1 Tax=Streptobacillus ratti TaxID=1720557 RepID=UPI0013015AF1|nr:hypothetical protein [Streptobacillus ratti]
MKIKGSKKKIKKKGVENKKSVMTPYEKISLLIMILTFITNIIMIVIMLRGV